MIVCHDGNLFSVKDNVDGRHKTAYVEKDGNLYVCHQSRCDGMTVAARCRDMCVHARKINSYAPIGTYGQQLRLNWHLWSTATPQLAPMVNSYAPIGTYGQQDRNSLASVADNWIDLDPESCVTSLAESPDSKYTPDSRYWERVDAKQSGAGYTESAFYKSMIRGEMDLAVKWTAYNSLEQAAFLLTQAP